MATTTEDTNVTTMENLFQRVVPKFYDNPETIGKIYFPYLRTNMNSATLDNNLETDWQLCFRKLHDSDARDYDIQQIMKEGTVGVENLKKMIECIKSTVTQNENCREWFGIDLDEVEDPEFEKQVLYRKMASTNFATEIKYNKNNKKVMPFMKIKLKNMETRPEGLRSKYYISGANMEKRETNTRELLNLPGTGSMKIKSVIEPSIYVKKHDSSWGVIFEGKEVHIFLTDYGFGTINDFEGYQYLKLNPATFYRNVSLDNLTIADIWNGPGIKTANVMENDSPFIFEIKAPISITPNNFDGKDLLASINLDSCEQLALWLKEVEERVKAVIPEEELQSLPPMKSCVYDKTNTFKFKFQAKPHAEKPGMDKAFQPQKIFKLKKDSNLELLGFEELTIMCEKNTSVNTEAAVQLNALLWVNNNNCGVSFRVVRAIIIEADNEGGNNNKRQKY